MVCHTDEIINSHQFPSIPKYIFDEIEVMAHQKDQVAKANGQKMEEIIFTQAEVDDLFAPLDNANSLEALKLRETLTTSAI